MNSTFSKIDILICLYRETRKLEMNNESIASDLEAPLPIPEGATVAPYSGITVSFAQMRTRRALRDRRREIARDQYERINDGILIASGRGENRYRVTGGLLEDLLPEVIRRLTDDGFAYHGDGGFSGEFTW
ncbi:unnamed protein product [marine sediment metagenome]|uniref:Uncharacterized protein n=1 Tax=marine sediment metagenome TaxID=412755 RepID=X1GHU5_9ZZZZ